MRKLLLATTAILGFVAAGAAHAAPAPSTAPVTVNVGGDVDVLAGLFHEAARNVAPTQRANHDFETLYGLNFDVNGKAGNGLEYGGKLTLDNNPDISNAFAGNGNSVQVDQAYIFLSSAFGKLQLGDSHGATDLALLAPVVGEGQVYGRYIDFLDTTAFAKNFVAGVDVTDHSTNITYYTPKVGNDTNKVQAAFSYVPNFYNNGAYVATTQNGTGPLGIGSSNVNSPYKDVVKGALAYTGTFHPVTVGASAQIISGSSGVKTAAPVTVAGASVSSDPTWMLNAPVGNVQDFTAWGLGAQAAAEGFTLGGSYLDQGHYDTVATQTKSQHVESAALKYEFNKVAVGVSYLGGEGYSNLLSSTAAGSTAVARNVNYVKDFSSYGVGGAYTWAPGLTSNVDGVSFQQKTDAGAKNDGYVLLVSQKLAF